jgi:hypothetical protein
MREMLSQELYYLYQIQYQMLLINLQFHLQLNKSIQQIQ